MFGRRATARAARRGAGEHGRARGTVRRCGAAIAAFENGRPMPRPMQPTCPVERCRRRAACLRACSRPGHPAGLDHPRALCRGQQDLAAAGVVRRAGRHPKLRAVSITDPDLPRGVQLSRAPSPTGWSSTFPRDVRELAGGRKRHRADAGAGARELNSDFVTFRDPRFRPRLWRSLAARPAHRYVFTLYALKVERLDIDDDADLRSISPPPSLPVTIDTASFVAVYGPAPEAAAQHERTSPCASIAGGQHEPIWKPKELRPRMDRALGAEGQRGPHPARHRPLLHRQVRPRHRRDGLPHRGPRGQDPAHRRGADAERHGLRLRASRRRAAPGRSSPSQFRRRCSTTSGRWRIRCTAAAASKATPCRSGRTCGR